jgi:DNA-binding LacI/PurR family transcriptional regulator
MFPRAKMPLRAGVSIATVSNVLDGKNKEFSSGTAERVLASARELGYQRNSVARSLARRRNYTLGLATFWRPHTQGNSFLSAFIFGFIDSADESDYQVKIIRLNEDEPQKTIRRLEDGSLDGVAILSPRVDSPIVEWSSRTSVPAIISGSLPPQAPIPCVGIDDVATMRNAITWLISLGHRRIALLNSEPNTWSHHLRHEGYLQAMRESNLALHKSWHQEYTTPDELPATLDKLLNASTRPTAIACHNDWIATKAIEELEKRGLQVPGDISVLGFNDDPVTFSQSPLSTVQHPILEIAIQSVHVLIQQIAQSASGAQQATPEQHAFMGKIIQRKTTAPPTHPTHEIFQ